MPKAAFDLAMAVGIYVVRWRRRKANLPEPEFKAWNVVVAFNILIQLYLIIMPWYPPAGGQYAGDVSFWYATYAVTGVGILLMCGLYYYVWAIVLPKWRDYSLRQELVTLDDGAQTHQLRKIRNSRIVEWDASHDAAGRAVGSSSKDARSEGESVLEVLGKNEKLGVKEAYVSQKDGNPV